MKITRYKSLDNVDADIIVQPRTKKGLHLIRGDNSIGKTTLLEALYLAETQTLDEFITALARLNNISDLAKEPLPNVSIGEHSSMYNSTDGQSTYYLKVKETAIVLPMRQASLVERYTKNVRLINDLTYIPFASIQRADAEKSLADYVDKLHPKKFHALKSLGETLHAFIKDDNGVITDLPLTNEGKGIQEFIQIICCIYKCEGGTLYVDDIASHITDRHMEYVLFTIATLAANLDVRVVATSNRKCVINLFKQLSRTLYDLDISNSELGDTGSHVINYVHPGTMICKQKLNP